MAFAVQRLVIAPASPPPTPPESPPNGLSLSSLPTSPSSPPAAAPIPPRRRLRVARLSGGLSAGARVWASFARGTTAAHRRSSSPNPPGNSRFAMQTHAHAMYLFSGVGGGGGEADYHGVPNWTSSSSSSPSWGRYIDDYASYSPEMTSNMHRRHQQQARSFDTSELAAMVSESTSAAGSSSASARGQLGSLRDGGMRRSATAAPVYASASGTNSVRAASAPICIPYSNAGVANGVSSPSFYVGSPPQSRPAFVTAFAALALTPPRTRNGRLDD